MKTNDLLSLFNLSKNEQEVYLILNESSWLTVLELSKKTSIKRTTLYRILDSLTQKGLVEVRVDDKTTYYSAGNVANFESMIIEQEKKIESMKAGLKSLTTKLSLLKKPSLLTTSVYFYKGKRGIQSMEWKISEQANTEILIFGANRWNIAVGIEFAEKIRQEYINKNIVVKEIMNQDKFEILDANGEASWTNNKQYILEYFYHRSINKKILDIQTEIIINSDSIFIQSYENDEIVGIELVSPAFTKSLKQLFKMVWNQAEKVDSFGGKDFN